MTGPDLAEELEMLTSPALSRIVEAGTTTVVVPFGSVEHHGGHLPIGTDALLAAVVAHEVATRLAALVAPLMHVGCSERHSGRPGTLTLRPDTLVDVAVDLGASLARQGFRVLLLVSSHGGNAPWLRAAASRLNDTHQNVLACAPDGDVGPSPGAHSGEWITSVMLAVRPDLVDLGRADHEVAGELQSAGPERGRDHLERYVAGIVESARSAMAATGR
jgi:creatinine amidohydrolase